MIKLAPLALACALAIAGAGVLTGLLLSTDEKSIKQMISNPKFFVTLKN